MEGELRAMVDLVIVRITADDVTFRLLLGLFLATLETSITATALVSIGEDFNATTTVCAVDTLAD